MTELAPAYGVGMGSGSRRWLGRWLTSAAVVAPLACGGAPAAEPHPPRTSGPPSDAKWEAVTFRDCERAQHATRFIESVEAGSRKSGSETCAELEANYRGTGDMPRDLRISIVQSAPPFRALRTVVVEAAEFAMDQTGLASDGVRLPEGVYPDPPSLQFLGEKLVLFTATHYEHCKIVDVETGEVTTHSPCGFTGGSPPLFKPDGVLLDPASGPPVLLRASTEEWAAAVDVGPTCP